MTTEKAVEVKRDSGLRGSHFVTLALQIVTPAVRERFEAAEVVVVDLHAKVTTISDANAKIRADLQADEREHEDLWRELQRHRQAGFRAPEAMAHRALALERRVHDLAGLFEKGRAKMETANKRMEVARTTARGILADALESDIKCLGQKSRGLVEQDAAFLLEFPHNAPPELSDLQSRAAQLDAIVVGLTGVSAYRGFEKAAGDDAIDIVIRAAGGIGVHAPLAV